MTRTPGPDRTACAIRFGRGGATRLVWRRDVPLRRPFEFSVDPADLLDEEASEQVDGED
ncbi:hypothetical protein [Micromonospora costi]|uniref:hypothetical protein n=1 Tax=Micromonospora costi TaxID=1530042 RepID=UPI001319F570|nr:hypothetical protein [Micromonospora costi]